MRVFISHKQEDEIPAKYIYERLSDLGVKAYLDLLEGDLFLDGEELTNHIKENLNSCTDILVVMSERTKESWWVPFEIGMAAQKDFPIVSYLINNVDLPDYLEYWPTLRRTTDLQKYVNAKQSVLNESYSGNKGLFNANYSETKEFYKKLKEIL